MSERELLLKIYWQALRDWERQAEEGVKYLITKWKATTPAGEEGNNG